jgi:hypothetical protein
MSDPASGPPDPAHSAAGTGTFAPPTGGLTAPLPADDATTGYVAAPVPNPPTGPATG